jgi:uncharacterized protein YacL
MATIKKVEKNKKEKIDKESKRTKRFISLPPRFVGILADEVAKTLIKRLPAMLPHRAQRKKNLKKIEDAVFLDTSAIIDGRVFDVIRLKVLTGSFIVLESVLLELKHIADSKDPVKKERGRKGLEYLDKLKKTKGIKLTVLVSNTGDKKEVDEKLIYAARQHNGRVITCDYNLEKKASIGGVTAINIHNLANSLKITAVPGEILNVNVLHRGKDVTQGVGYLEDGTMIVVENGSDNLGQTIGVMVSRVIQTTAGRILFAKKI